MTFTLYTHTPGVSLCVQIFSYKDTSQIGVNGPTTVSFLTINNKGISDAWSHSEVLRVRASIYELGEDTIQTIIARLLTAEIILKNNMRER